MSGREIRKNERKEDTSKNEKGKKPNRMLEALNKMGLAKPLASGVMTAATSVVLAAGCTASDRPEKDAQTEDVEDEDALQFHLPPLIVDVPPKIPHDAETDGDVVEDGVTDVPEDVAEEEVVGACSAMDDLQTRWINNDGSVEVVGNVGVKYKGTDTSGNAVYDLLCEDVVVRSDIATPLYTDVTVDVSEHAFSVSLRTNLADSTRCNVRIDVDA